MNTELVTIMDGKAVTTSLKIAEVFEKQHKHVLEAIKNLDMPEDFREPNFRPTVYERPNPSGGKPIPTPMYNITRDGFTLLAMGFTGKKAMEFKLRYIEAFNAMEKLLRDGATADPVIRDLADKIRSRALEQVKHDIACIRNVVCDELHTRGYSIDAELLATLPLSGEATNDNMLRQMIDASNRKIANPRLRGSATINLALENE